MAAQMRQKSGPEKAPAEQVAKDIRRATRRQSAEETIRIVLEGVPGKDALPPEIAYHAVREDLAVLDDAASGGAAPVVPQFISPAAPLMLDRHTWRAGLLRLCDIGSTYRGPHCRGRDEGGVAPTEVLG